VSKYVSKTFTGPQVFGRQRYGVAEGFQPSTQRIVGTSAAGVLAEAVAQMGGAPSRRSLSMYCSATIQPRLAASRRQSSTWRLTPNPEPSMSLLIRA
jgi:hypothetical protein